MKFFARTRATKAASAKKKGKRRLGWKLTLAGLFLAGGVGVLAFYAVWAQTFDMKRLGAMPERNTVFDVDGKIYSRLAGANRLRLSLNEVSPLFIDAVLAREDTRFYQHGGIDPRGVARALYRDIITRSTKEGASSITQQVARNSLPLGGRTISRKLLEAMVALRIERVFTKEQILELYVNRIYFGSGCYGVETASQAYFGKSASKLNLSEAALLAGLIRSPNRFSPLKNPQGATVQRDTVLDRMLELKKISAAQVEQAKLTKVTSRPRRAAAHPGELRDGRGAAGFESAAHPGPDRQRRPLYLHHARSRRAKLRDRSDREAADEDRARARVSSSAESELSAAGRG